MFGNKQNKRNLIIKFCNFGSWMHHLYVFKHIRGFRFPHLERCTRSWQLPARRIMTVLSALHVVLQVSPSTDVTFDICRRSAFHRGPILLSFATDAAAAAAAIYNMSLGESSRVCAVCCVVCVAAGRCRRVHHLASVRLPN
jgi:hypothetical protein